MSNRTVFKVADELQFDWSISSRKPCVVWRKQVHVQGFGWNRKCCANGNSVPTCRNGEKWSISRGAFH